MCSKPGDHHLGSHRLFLGLGFIRKAMSILCSQVVGGGEMGSFPLLTWWCCCSPRSCPRGEHAPRHLCSHRDTRIHPLPGRGRAPGHSGQVEQRRTSPANREGNEVPRGGMRWGHGGVQTLTASAKAGEHPWAPCGAARRQEGSSPVGGMTLLFLISGGQS